MANVAVLMYVYAAPDAHILTTCMWQAPEEGGTQGFRGGLNPVFKDDDGDDDDDDVSRERHKDSVIRHLIQAVRKAACTAINKYK